MDNDIFERLDVLHVWPQSVADHHADILTPRQIKKLYEVGKVATDVATTIETLTADLARVTAERDATRESLDALRKPVNLCESNDAAAMRFIDILRSDIAASVTILPDNEEADTLDMQRAIEVQADWANAEWEPARFYGETILQALAKAVCARKAALGEKP